MVTGNFIPSGNRFSNQRASFMRAYLLILVLCLIFPVVAASIANPPAGKSPLADKVYADNELIIKFTQNLNKIDRDAILSLVKGSIIRKFNLIDAYHVKISDISVDSAVNFLKGNVGIVYAEPNYVWHASYIPNDPFFNNLWGMNNTGQTGGIFDADIDAAEAWDIETGDTVIIGIIDTGVDTAHPDLNANIWHNPNEIPGNGVDDDGNGYVDDACGWDWVNNDNDPFDDFGHGTHCAGTAAGVGNNNVGVAGVCWTARIMPLKFLDSYGSGYTDDAVLALEYATMMGANLTSNSWGGGGYSAALEDAIYQSGLSDMLFVAAAGNGYNNNDYSPFYPASYTLDNIIAVAATDHNDNLADEGYWGSNFGLTSVDLGAPGVYIYSTTPYNTYAFYGGTSMATPHVSGAAGLVWSKYPLLTNLQVKERILMMVDTLPSLVGSCVTGGRLNVFMAIAEADSIPPSPIMDLAIYETNGSWIKLTWTASGDDSISGLASKYNIRYSLYPIDESNFEYADQATGEPNPQPYGETEYFKVENLNFSTTYYFAIKVGDEWSNSSEISNSPSGATLGPPVISVLPDYLSDNLYTGETSSHPFTIYNNGVSELLFDIDIEVIDSSPKFNSEPPILTIDKNRIRTNFDNLGSSLSGQMATVPSAVTPEMVIQLHTSNNVDKAKGAPHIAVLGADAYGDLLPDVADYLINSGEFASVTTLNGYYYTPTLAELQLYDAVAVFGWYTWYDTYSVGNVLADFVDAGGRLMIANGANAIGGDWQVGGRFDSENYWLIEPYYYTGDSYHTLGAVYEPGHPVMNGVNSVATGVKLDYGTPVDPEALRIADFTDGAPLVVTKKIGISRRVDISFPMVTDNAEPGWGIDLNTDADQLIINSLKWLAKGGGQWLSAVPDSGMVPAGGSLDISAIFNAEGLYGGDYNANLIIASNDPNTPTPTVSAFLHVTGAPDIQAEDSLDFGNVYIGAVRTDTLLIYNNGTDSLFVSSIGSDNSAFTPNIFSCSIGPDESQAVLMEFAPISETYYEGILSITSNDPDEPIIYITLKGWGVTPPEIEVTPDSLYDSLYTGEQSNQLLTIANTGGSDLVFDLEIEPITPKKPNPVREQILKDEDLQKIADQTSRKSNDNTYPSVMAPKLTGISSAKANSALIFRDNLAWGFDVNVPLLQYFGADITTATSGEMATIDLNQFDVILFESQQSTYFYQTYMANLTRFESYLNSGGVIELHTACYFSDRIPDMPLPGGAKTLSWETGCYYNYIADPTHPIVAGAYDPLYGNYASHEGFENLPSGAKVITTDEYGNPSTIEYKVGMGTLIATGMPWEFNYYFGNNSGDPLLPNALQYSLEKSGDKWITVNPTSGTLPIASSVDINVLFNAVGLYGGDYYANIIINNNDLDESHYIVPAHLHVTGAPDIELSDTSFDFDSIYVGWSSTDTVIIGNVGTDLLTISSITSDNPNFSVSLFSINLAPEEETPLQITFIPNSTGEFNGTITIESDDPDEPVLIVSLHGVGILPPIISVEPTSLYADLLTGESSYDTITISNSGNSDLIFNINVLPGKSGTNESNGISVRPISATKIAGNQESQAKNNALVNKPMPIKPDNNISDSTIVTSPEYAGANARRNYVGTKSVSLPYSDGFEDGDYNGWFEDWGYGVREVTNQTAATGQYSFHYNYLEYYEDHLHGIHQEFEPNSQPEYISFYIRSGSTSTSDAYFVMLDSSWWYDIIWFFASQDGKLYINDYAYSNYSYEALQWYHIEFRNIDWSSKNFDFYVDGQLVTEDIPFRNAYSVNSIGSLFLYNYSANSEAWWDDIVIGGMQYLELSDYSGTVPANSAMEIEVKFDATGMYGGDYYSNIVINNNDSNNAAVTIPAHLHVTGAPDITLSDSTFDFGNTFINGHRYDTLIISNDGTDILSITNMYSDNPDFAINMNTADIAPNDSIIVVISFSPTVVGAIEGKLTIESNDNDEPALTVNLYGNGLEPPIISVSPDSLFADLFTNDSSIQIMTIGNNNGGSDLEYKIAIRQTAVPRDLVKECLEGITATGTAMHDGKQYSTFTEAEKPLFKERLDTFHKKINSLSSCRDIPSIGVVGDDAYYVAYYLMMDSNLSSNYIFYEQSYYGDYSYISGYDGLIVPEWDYGIYIDEANSLKAYYESGRPIFMAMDDLDDEPLEVQNILYPIFGINGANDGDFYWGSVNPNNPITEGITYIDYPGGDNDWYTLNGADWIFAGSDGNYYGVSYSGLSNTVLMGEYLMGWYWANPLLIVNAINWMMQGVNWLSATPNQGIVPIESSTDIQMIFDATGMYGGDYYADVKILNNDPLDSIHIIPAHLHVTGAPDIEVSDSALYFGDVYLGFSKALPLTIGNIGTDNLVISDIALDHADFSVDITSFTLPPFEDQGVIITFTPSQPGVVEAKLDITSNDPKEPIYTVMVYGNARECPNIAYTPDMLIDSLLTGAVSIDTLFLKNVGQDTLEFNFSDFSALKLLHNPNIDKNKHSTFEPLNLGKNEIDPRKGDPVILGAGGPDSSGYTWIDSDAPGGPVFGFIDISLTGTPVGGLYDDNHVGPFPIGFSFPFYDSAYTEFYIQSNGVINFDNQYITLSHDPIPLMDGYNNLIAWCWDDLYPNGNVYYQIIGDMLVIQYDDYGEFGGSGKVDAEVIIYSNGRILIQYDDFRDGFDTYNCTVGIENTDGSDGLQVAFNTMYLHNDLAVLFSQKPLWISDITPSSGEVPTGDSILVQVTVDAAQMYGGDYYDSIHVLSNDCDNPDTAIPVFLHVTGVQDIFVVPDSLSYGLTFVADSSYGILTISNNGTDLLTVSDISSDHPYFTVDITNFSLAPNESRDVTVMFAPSDSGYVEAKLDIYSNDPDESTYTVSLSGFGAYPPDIDVPTSPLIHDSMYSGDIVTDTVTISNVGLYDLIFNIQVYQTSKLTEDNENPIENIIKPLSIRKLSSDNKATSTLVNNKPFPDFNRDSLNIPYDGSKAYNIPYYDGFEDGNLDDWYQFGSSGISEVTDSTAAEGQYSFHNLNYYDWDCTGIFQLFEYGSRPNHISFYIRFAGTDIVGGYTYMGSNAWYQAIWFYGGADGRLYINYETGGDNSYIYSANRWYHIAFGNIDWSAKNFDYYVDGALIKGNIPFTNGEYVDDIADLYLYNCSPGSETWWDEIRVGSIPYITIEPESDAVSPGNSVDIEITFSAEGIPFGDFYADINILSNDPDESSVIIPTYMHVIGVPEIAVNPDTLRYDSTPVGMSLVDSLIIANIGTEPLHIYDISSDNPYFYPNIDSTVIPAGGTELVMVTYVPGDEGHHEGVLSIISNANNDDTVMIPLFGDGYYPGDILVVPESLNIIIAAGDSMTAPFYIINEGARPIYYNILVDGAYLDDSMPPKNSHQSSIIPEWDRNEVLERIKNLSISSDSSQSLLGTPHGANPNGNLQSQPQPNIKANGGTVLHSIPAPGNVMGLTFLKGSLWAIVDTKPNQSIFELSPIDGAVLSSFEIGYMRNIGLTNDLQNLWLADFALGMVSQYSTDGVLLSSWSSPLGNYLRGIAWDGSSLWLGGSNCEMLIQTDTNGFILGGKYLPYSLIGWAMDMEWVPSHDDGNLWVIDSWTYYDINQLNTATNPPYLVQDFMHPDPANLPEGIAHDGNNLWVSGYISPYIYQVDDGIQDLSWLRTDPTFGIVQPGDTAEIAAIIDASQLTEGDYYALLNIYSDDPDECITVLPVALHVVTSTACGRVIDPYGNPIPNTAVEIWDNFPNGNLLHILTTDSIGQFNCDSISSYPFDIYAYHDGYYPAILENGDSSLTYYELILAPRPQVTPTWEATFFYCPDNTYFGIPLPVGSVIDAYDPDGILCGSWYVVNPGHYGFMPVYRDDFTTPEDEGAEPGDQITFYINGQMALSEPKAFWTYNGDRQQVCVSLPGIYTQDIVLHNGWNLVSWNLDTPDDSIENVLGSVMDCIIVVLGFDQGGVTYDPNLPDYSTLESVDHLHGYWIKMDCERTLTIQGLPVPITTPIMLETGWNLVSYLPLFSDTVPHALSSVMDNLIVAIGFDSGAITYDPALPEFSTLHFMNPGFGYWLKIMMDDILIYPGKGSILAKPSVSAGKVNIEITNSIHQSNNWINLLAKELKLDGEVVPAGTTITARNLNGDLIGAAILKRNGALDFMPVYGADPASPQKAGLSSGDKFHLEINGVITREEFVWTEFGAKIEIKSLTTKPIDNLVPAEFCLYQNYPNPFNPFTEISFALPTAENVTIEIFNIAGQKVSALINQRMEAGKHTIRWDGKVDSGADLASGVYLYRLKAGEYSDVKKMMLLK